MHLDTLIFPVINFVLYLALLTWAYKKYIAGSLKARAASIAQLINQASIDAANAERERAGVQAELDDLERYRDERIQEFQQEGERIAAAVLESAKQEAQRILVDAQLQAETLKGQAEKEIRLEIIQGALSRARQKFSQEFTSEKDAQFRKEVLAAVL